MTPTHLDPQVFAAYLERTRWFAGKGRPFEVSDVRVIGEVPGRVEASPWVVIHLVELTYADTEAGHESGNELYQVPLALYTDPETRLDRAFLGWWEDPEHGWVHAYDALHDKVAMACWMRSFDQAAGETQGNATDAASGLAFHRLPGYDLDTDAASTLFSGEQSNSSVAFGEDAMMKVFRKVTPGINPDIQVHEVLTNAGSEHIAALYGWLDILDEESDSVIQLAMLQQFLRTASDGWELALGSVRSLLAEADEPAKESGGDFAGEATRLGDSLREVHLDLATAFGTETLDTGGLAAAMRARLEAAHEIVPLLEPHLGALNALYDDLGSLGDIQVQRIHGDLHLGQTLRTSRGWKIVDFEGEPAKALSERLLPDSPWRDVAGMMRSFDYAPHVVERTQNESDEIEFGERSLRSQEWAERNQRYFLTAYAAGAELTPEQQILLDAYVADKAVYETVYETRNRPSWVAIPLEAVARIGVA